MMSASRTGDGQAEVDAFRCNQCQIQVTACLCHQQSFAHLFSECSQDSHKMLYMTFNPPSLFSLLGFRELLVTVRLKRRQKKSCFDRRSASMLVPRVCCSTRNDGSGNLALLIGSKSCFASPSPVFSLQDLVLLSADRIRKGNKDFGHLLEGSSPVAATSPPRDTS